MSYASRVLIRPVQQFGQLTVFDSEQIPHGGTRMTGHQHSTRLDVPLVSKTLPIWQARMMMMMMMIMMMMLMMILMMEAAGRKSEKKYIGT